MFQTLKRKKKRRKMSPKAGPPRPFSEDDEKENTRSSRAPRQKRFLRRERRHVRSRRTGGGAYGGASQHRGDAIRPYPPRRISGETRARTRSRPFPGPRQILRSLRCDPPRLVGRHAGDIKGTF